jgi:hypothetical protein
MPAGIVRANGVNTLAIAVWNEGRSTGGLGTIRLQRYANLATSLRIADVASPPYRPR